MLPSLISYRQGALAVFRLPGMGAYNCWISTAVCSVNPPLVDVPFNNRGIYLPWNRLFLTRSLNPSAVTFCLEIPTHRLDLISHFIKAQVL